MKKYKFLLKPLFFIFNILFATWLVFKIEQISPSDFGEYKYLFEDPLNRDSVLEHHRRYLLKIGLDYKTGALDSAAFEKELNRYLKKSVNIPHN